MKDSDFKISSLDVSIWLKKASDVSSYFMSLLAAFLLTVIASFIYPYLEYSYTEETVYQASHLKLGFNAIFILGAILLSYALINTFLSYYYGAKAEDKNISPLYTFKLFLKPVSLIIMLFINMFNVLLYPLFLIPGFIITTIFGISNYYLSRDNVSISDALRRNSKYSKGFRLDLIFIYLLGILMFIISMAIAFFVTKYLGSFYHIGSLPSLLTLFTGITLLLFSPFMARMKLRIARYQYLFMDVRHKDFIKRMEEAKLKAKNNKSTLSVSDSLESFDIVQCPNCGMMVTSQVCPRCGKKLK